MIRCWTYCNFVHISKDEFVKIILKTFTNDSNISISIFIDFYMPIFTLISTLNIHINMNFQKITKLALKFLIKG